MKNVLSLGLVAIVLALPASVSAAPITVSIGNTASGFVSGTTKTSTQMTTAQTGEPSPFSGACGSDPSSNCTASWTFNYTVPAGESVTAGILSLGLSDLDSHASGNQVASFQIVGGDALTSAFNTAAEGLNAGGGSINNEYDVFTFNLADLTALDSGTAQVQLLLQGPGLGVLGNTSFNGAFLLYSTLDLRTESNQLPPVPEPASLLLLASGLAGIVARARRRPRG